ncbi:MAG: nucleotide exchange factor GrpE [Myxococcota bacterium]
MGEAKDLRDAGGEAPADEPTEGDHGGEEVVAGGEASDSRLAEVTEERDRLKEQLLRIAADFENFRKRAKRDVEEAERRGREEALREVLPVIDNLERAVAAADSATEVQAVAEGVRMVLRMFEDVAGRIGLERVHSVGQRFDPNVHDAMQQHESSEHPPGTIVQELVPGYRLGERLLRPALVAVARPPQGSGEQGGGETPTGEGGG